ncbi:Acyl-coenzyme A thioesterase PaaI, contains HGG motif [Geodermatophilus siccatus]|uniref:Acyl-coenzyme A thioesterase PaaI, contains HGG motif n=1 Tax=Geodermatophilus siccatus TaxID=1137991 RepID=A0A1H0AZE6_9ACTN|nr:PaaI family thioesterase [Geodermatophilus siccatus]SDN38433.1 Acyl-coenzyme A thioesterase PaaI, contains HGG motif [Geodermatophilus siccatus]
MTSDAGGQPYDADLMAAVTELGTALRELVDASVLTTVPADQLRAAAADARAVTARLAAAQRPVTQLPVLDDPLVFRRVYNPVSGVGSALAPPVRIRRVEGGVVGEALLGPAYEGPPGYVHGGMSSLLMDQLLGSAAIAAGLWGMTVRLEVDYRRPVPLSTPLTMRAQVTEAAGRKCAVTGTIATTAAPDRTLVEARGVFVMPREELRADYFGAITDASGQHRPPGRPTDATALSDRP